jgi:hypothetical protein
MRKVLQTQSVLLYVTARVKQLVLLCQAAMFKQLVRWLLNEEDTANAIRAVIRDSKGWTVSAVMSGGKV